MPDDARWRKWDEGCEQDEPRNEFVIPYLASEIDNRTPAVVLDVGAGSGYITHQLIRRLGDVEIRWVLVDADEGAYRWLLARFSDISQVLIRHQRVPPIPNLENEALQLVFLSYTLLEMSIDEFHDLLRGLLLNSILVLIVPDILEDVNESGSLDSDLFWSDGSIQLEKMDKFTGEPYPFTAHRFELLLEVLTKAGYAVERVERYVGERSARAHYAVTAVKSRAPD